MWVDPQGFGTDIDTLSLKRSTSASTGGIQWPYLLVITSTDYKSRVVFDLWKRHHTPPHTDTAREERSRITLKRIQLHHLQDAATD
jgi:hypothetical protein